MQLHDLRSHPVIKFFAYGAFILIIISFVAFYGKIGSDRPVESRQPVARLKSDSALSFLPGRQWEFIQPAEVLRARDLVVERKLGFLPQQFLQFLQQQARDFRWLTTDEESIRKAVDIRMLGREAERIGLVVPDADVKNFVLTRFLNIENFERTASGYGMTPDQFYQTLKDEQRAARMERLIANETRVSLYELWLEYLLVHEKLVLELASYPAEKYADKASVSEEEMRNWLAEHEDDFRLPDRRRYSYVKLDLSTIRDGLAPSDDELRAWFERDRGRFAAAEAVRLRDFYAPVNEDQNTTVALSLVSLARAELTADDTLTTASPDWSEVASRVESRIPGSTLYYRDLGFVDRSDANRTGYGPAYLDRAFTIADDAISTPVTSPTGVHVLQRLEYRAAGVRPFEDVKAEVLEAYKDEKSREEFKAAFDRYKAEVANFTNLRDFAQSVGLEDRLTTMTPATSVFIPEIGSLAESRSYLRSLEPNRPSEVIPMPQRDPVSLVVLQIVQEEPSHVPPFEEVRDRIEEILRKRGGRDLAKADAEAALASIREGKVFGEAVVSAPGEIRETDPFTRIESGQAIGLPLVNFMRETTRLAQGTVGMTPYGPSAEEADGYAVWRVASIEQPSRDKFRQERRQFEAEVLLLQGLTVVEEWLADRRREAGYELLVDLGADEESPSTDEVPAPAGDAPASAGE